MQRLAIILLISTVVCFGQDVLVRIPRRCDMAQVEWPMVRCTTSTGEISVIPAPGEAPVELAEMPDSVPEPFCRLSAYGGCLELLDEGTIKRSETDDRVDVPAVHHKHRTGTWCIPDIRYCEGIYDETWTCADKSRTLLTSEDGKKHCIKLEVIR